MWLTSCVLVAALQFSAARVVSTSIHRPLSKQREAGELPFDEGVALFYASLSQAAYCGNSTSLSEWTCPACKRVGNTIRTDTLKVVRHSELIQLRPTLAFLARYDAQSQEDEGCVLAFRGSETVENWLTDFQFWRTGFKRMPDCTNCFAEEGFYKIWTQVKEDIVRTLESVGCSPDKARSLYVTGHSLGAAVAHLAMYELSRMGYDVRQSYTFESPRVGNYGFADRFKEQLGRPVPSFRVTHNKDPVVHLPPVALGYRHVDTEVYYDEFANVTICDGGSGLECANQHDYMTVLDPRDHCNIPLGIDGNICRCSGDGEDTIHADVVV